MSDTPRTDALIQDLGITSATEGRIFSEMKKLERDLAAAQARIAELERERDALAVDARYGQAIRDAFHNGELFMALNANDVFAYACSDQEDIESTAELDEIVRIQQTEGWSGLVRWMEKKRGQTIIASAISTAMERK